MIPSALPGGSPATIAALRDVLGIELLQAALSTPYASQALGEAGTTTGQYFAVDAGGGTVSIYLRTGGGSTLEGTVNVSGVAGGGGGGGGGGTVTSIGLTSGVGISVTGASPITGSGSWLLTLSAFLQTWSGIDPTTKSDVGHTHTFASLTSKPTTLAGYGITDAAALGHSHTFASITSKPTTLAGYSISDAVSLTSFAAATGASTMGYQPAGGSALLRTAQSKLRDQSVHLFDFVPAAEHAAILNGTSSYNCGPALALAITAAQANTLSANEVILPKGLVNTGQVFVITSPVRLVGQGGGAAPGYSSFPTTLGTTIKYTGAVTSAVMFKFNNVNHGGAGMSHLAIDGNGVALQGLILDAVLGFSSDGLYITGCTNALLGLISTGETTSWNSFKNLYLEGELNGAASSTALWLSGGNGIAGAGSNACHCTFENVHINHGGLRSGILLGGVDNISFTMIYIYRASGSRPGVEVVHEQQGGVWFPVCNNFYHLQAGAGGWVELAGGNSTYPTACIYGYQTDNGQPLPVTNGRRLPFMSGAGYLLGVTSIGKTSYGGDWAGSVTALSGTTSTVVTFPSGARSNAAYVVVLNVPTTLDWAIQSKTAAGFTIVWASALPSNYSCDWLILGG